MAARRIRKSGSRRICHSIARLAPFRPSGLVLLTGTGSGRDPDDARATVVDGLRTIAAEAERHGVRVGIEPYQRDGGEQWTIATSIPDAVELIHEAGDPPALGIQFDVWHLWNTPTLFDDIANEVAASPACTSATCASRRAAGPIGRCRAMAPADVPAILRALDDAGWEGLYDIEIFSDDGTFGSSYPDSYWAAPADDVLAQARETFARCWDATRVPTPPSTMKEHR